MIVWKGNDAMFNGQVVHVFDTDFIKLEAKVGVLDTNGMCWDPQWISFDALEDVVDIAPIWAYNSHTKQKE